MTGILLLLLKQEQIKSMKKDSDFRKILHSLLRFSMIQAFAAIILSGISLAIEPMKLHRNVRTIAADITVSGKVTNDKGEALPGVSILAKGTQQGATTDVDGNFTITVRNSDATLVFSFVGYIPQEIIIGNKTKIEVFLKVDEKILESYLTFKYAPDIVVKSGGDHLTDFLIWQ